MSTWFRWNDMALCLLSFHDWFSRHGALLTPVSFHLVQVESSMALCLPGRHRSRAKRFASSVDHLNQVHGALLTPESVQSAMAL